MFLIELTGLKNKKPILINPEHIVMVDSGQHESGDEEGMTREDCSVVFVKDVKLVVTESVDKIRSLIAGAARQGG